MEGLEWRELLSGLGTRIGGGSEGAFFQRAFGSRENFRGLNLKAFLLIIIKVIKYFVVN